MQALYEAYKAKGVQFFLVYVREAHPVPEAAPANDPRLRRFGGVRVAQHKTDQERAAAAGRCSVGLGLTLPVLLDALDGSAERAYRGWPAATAVIDLQGRIAFHAPGRPDGCRPEEARAALERVLAASGRPESRPAETREAPGPASRPVTPEPCPRSGSADTPAPAPRPASGSPGRRG